MLVAEPCRLWPELQLSCVVPNHTNVGFIETGLCDCLYLDGQLDASIGGPLQLGDYSRHNRF